MSKTCPACGQVIPVDLLGEPLNPKTLVQQFIALYCEHFKARYNTNPIINGAESGSAKRVVQDIGIKRAMELVLAYLMMNDPYFMTRRHDLKTFSLNLSKVAIFADSGVQLTQTEIRQADRRQATGNAFAKHLKET